MALQDVCGFLDTPVHPKWNSLASLFMPEEDAPLFFGGDTRGRVGWGGLDTSWRNSGCPLHLYLPVQEFLTQSPIYFGQINPNTAPSQGAPSDPRSPLYPFSLPSSPSSCPLSLLSSTSPSVPLPFPLSHGTTTLAFVFQGGIVAAADTRSSCSGLVACPASQKILPVHSHLVGTTSGTSADCALWKRILARECRLYQLRNRRRLSIGGAAKLLSYMLHPFKGTELCVAATLCGWDGEEGGRGTGPEGGGGCTDLEVASEIQTERRDRGGGGGEEKEEDEEEGHTGPGVEAKDVSKKITGREMEGQKETGEERGKEKLVVPSAATTTAETCSKSTESRVNTLLSAGQKSRQEGADALGAGRCSRTTPSTRGQQSAATASSHCGPRLIYVCSDGTLLKGELFSVGSGSPYAYSVLDRGLRWGLGVAEACSLAREAVYRATHRDAYSGNCVDLYHVTAHGWRRRKREDLKEEYYREKERERERVEERRREAEVERRGKEKEADD